MIFSVKYQFVHPHFAGEFGVVYKAHMVSAKPVLSRKISVRSFTTDPTMPEIVAVKTLKG